MNTLRNELKQQFSQIPNELITDTNLCNGSLRVLLYLFTKPNDWNVYNKDICKQLNISEQTLTKYWKKLLNSGWLKREISKNKDGKLTGGYTYFIGKFSVSIQSTESVKSIEHSNNKLINKEETNIKENIKEKTIISKEDLIKTSFEKIKKNYSFIDFNSFDKLYRHLEKKFEKLTNIRLSNNIKKLNDNPDLFSIAVDKMIEIDYNGLFVPTINQQSKSNQPTMEDTIATIRRVLNKDNGCQNEC